MESILKSEKVVQGQQYVKIVDNISTKPNAGPINLSGPQPIHSAPVMPVPGMPAPGMPSPYGGAYPP